MGASDDTLLDAPMSCLSDFIFRCLLRQIAFTLSFLNKQFLKIFHSLLFCVIRPSNQPKPCSGLWTVWNLRVMPQRKHHQWVSSPLPNSFLLIIKCLVFIFTSLNLLLFSLQLQLKQMRLLTPWELHQRKRTGSTWMPVSYNIPTASSHASPCLRRRCRGRYLTSPCAVLQELTAWNESLSFLDPVYFHCLFFFSGQIQLIHANILFFWRQWGPCGWVCFDDRKSFYENKHLIQPSFSAFIIFWSKPTSFFDITLDPLSKSNISHVLKFHFFFF